MRSWSESDRALDDPCHAVDRGVGDPVEFVASIKHNAPGVNRRAVSNAQTSLALTAVRRAAAVLKKDAKASKSIATLSRSEIRPPTCICDSGFASRYRCPPVDAYC